MTIAIDFDGTIVTHRYPQIGEEIPFATEALKLLIKQQHRLILWTVREGDLLKEAVDWCRERGVEFYAVIYTKNTSNRSVPIDLEEAYLLVAGADVWLNVGNVATRAELEAQYPKFADAACVRNGEVFNCNKRVNAAGGNDYWESGVVRPDVILHDLIAIMHPEVLAENDRELYYYRQIE